MPSTTSSPVPPKTGRFPSLHQDPRFRAAVSQAVRLKVHQLIEAGSLLRAPRPNKQCRGNWKPRMDLVDDLSCPNIIAIFELPGVKNEHITLQIKDKRLVVVGNRVDPYTEALAAASTVSGSQSQSASATDATEDATAASNVPTTSFDSSPNSSTNKSIRELRYGSFFRSISIPEGIKQSEVTAGLQDGMLTVTWPRIPASSRQSALQMTPGGNTSINSVANNAIPSARTTSLDNAIAMVQ